MIEFRNLSLQYDDNLLFRNLSLSIAKGEKICITGKSGCGKSSIISSILGFITPVEGEIQINNQLLTPATSVKIRESIAFLPQDFSFPFSTVKELVYAPFQFKINRQKEPSEEKIFSMFDQLDLERTLLLQNLNEISGGQKQRLLLAIVALLDKDIVLLDEPTSALDSASVEVVTRFLKDMPKTMVIVTHDESFAKQFDRIISFENLITHKYGHHLSTTPFGVSFIACSSLFSSIL